MADPPPDIVVPTPYGTINFPHDTPREVVVSKSNDWIKQHEPITEPIARAIKQAPYTRGAGIYGTMTPAMRGAFNVAETDVAEWARQQLHRIPWIKDLFPDQGALEGFREKNRQLATSGTPAERVAGQIGGTVFNPVNIGIGKAAQTAARTAVEAAQGPSQLGRVIGGAAAGGAGGATQPGPPGETGKEAGERTKQEATEGGTLGGALSLLLAGHGGEAADIMAAKIRPTLADVVPFGVGQQFEHLAARVPILRSFVQRGGERQVEDYNRFLYRYAAEPTAGLVEAPPYVGTKGLNKLKGDIGNEMNLSLGNLSITGQAVAPILSRFRAAVFQNFPGGASFTAANRKYIERAIKDSVERPIVLSGGRATGDTLRTMDSELSKLAEQKSRTAVSADDYNTAKALRMLQMEIRNNLQGSAEWKQRYTRSREAYARYKEVAEAAGKGQKGELATPDTYRSNMQRRLGSPDRYAELDDPRKTVTESASTLGVGKRLPPVSALETGILGHLVGWPAAAGFSIPTAAAYSAPGMWALAHQPELMTPLAALATQAQGGDRQ